MDNQDKQRFINKYNNLLIDLESDNINIESLGFIKDNCNTMLLGIFIHCIENIEIFTDEQLNNIINFY